MGTPHLTVALAHSAGVWRQPPLHLALGTLTPEQVEIIGVIGVGVVALLLLVLLAARWLKGRRAQSPGPQQPMEAPELYDLRTADLADDIRFCVEIAREVGGPVLELGAGTGRITLALAKTGLIVTGLEPSRLMLQRAKLKAEQLPPKRQPEWVEGDLTSFSLGGRKFRLILIPANALQELGGDLTEIEKCLRAAAQHLEPEGKLVVIVQAPRWEALKIERRYLKTIHNPRTGELITIYHSLEVDPIWHELKGAYEYEIWNQAGRVRQVIAPFKGCYVTCPEMSLLLRDARLKSEHIYGSFAREPLSLRSKQMIFVASLLPVPQPASPPALPQPAPAPVPALVGAASAVDQSGGAITAASTSLPAPAVAASAAAIPPALPAAGGTGRANPAGASGTAAAQSLQPPAAPPSGRRQTTPRRPTKQGTP